MEADGKDYNACFYNTFFKKTIWGLKLCNFEGFYIEYNIFLILMMNLKTLFEIIEEKVF